MADYLVSLTIWAALYSLFALGLNLQWGFAGLINFGHVAFMTLGAYTTALLTLQGVPIILAVFCGMIIAACLGLLIGMSTLRLREDYLAIVTIGMSELIRLFVLNEEEITKGAFGVQRYPLPFNINPNPISKITFIIVFTIVAIYALWQLWKSLKKEWLSSQEIKGKSYKPRSQKSILIWGIIAALVIIVLYLNGIISLANYGYKDGLMVFILVILALVYGALEFLSHSPWGRILKAIREDDTVPLALGKNVFWYKLQAFMLGGAIAGLAGSFFAWQLTTIYPTNFEPILTFTAWIIVILGGSGSNAGTLLGAIIYWTYDSLTRFALPLLPFFKSDSQLGSFRIMVIGLILMILMRSRPQGILGKKEELTLGR
ncbi:branched-chain amino acid ABC transporter permease [Aphanothece hegewaldii CCALA 016]|uniref:Branched-chain amino acid ABC transporter permease n=1 Tax=Aphanothece hegewaldii CCALA 016 TaxID=2107694 RepID=A0A2T1M0R1_9CHRO|nr:branched-chain amino acid ABC transporter permease [Aphanothece hegewaldii]PSF38253.1 branched-chain amino acid ABC transporter permease [Aphanothece hegewaldii CCALA 016]